MIGQPEENAAEQEELLAKRNAAVDEAKKETAESLINYAAAVMKPELDKARREREEQLPSVGVEIPPRTNVS